MWSPTFVTLACRIWGLRQRWKNRYIPKDPWQAQLTCQPASLHKWWALCSGRCFVSKYKMESDGWEITWTSGHNMHVYKCEYIYVYMANIHEYLSLYTTILTILIFCRSCSWVQQYQNLILIQILSPDWVFL